MDISESGRQIGEKLFALLDTEQQKDLLQYILNRENLSDFPDIFLCTVSKCHGFQNGSVQPLLEIREGDLYFCLKERTVCVGGQEIELTAKEFYIWIEKSIVAVLLIDTVALIGILIVGITKVSLGHSPAFKS